MRKFLLLFLIGYCSYAQNNYDYNIEYFPKENQITFYSKEKNLEVGSTITITYSNFPSQDSSWFWFVVMPYKEKYDTTNFLAGSGRLDFSDYISKNGKWTTTINQEGKFKILAINGISAFTLQSFTLIKLNITKKKLDINDLSKETISYIFPNPTNGLFTIKAEEPISEIQIHDQLGRCVLKTDSNSVDITAQPNGIYLATIQDKNGTVSKRKIIKK